MMMIIIIIIINIIIIMVCHSIHDNDHDIDRKQNIGDAILCKSGATLSHNSAVDNTIKNIYFNTKDDLFFYICYIKENHPYTKSLKRYVCILIEDRDCIIMFQLNITVTNHYKNFLMDKT